MSEEADQRAAVLAEAMTWRGTPFHDDAWLKGVGVDCAHFCAEVYQNAGMIPRLDIERYSAQWFLHRDEERFLSYVFKVSREIDIADAKPGDMVVYKFGRCFAHGAIVIDWPRSIIHAHKMSGCVLVSGPFESNLAGRETRAFSFWSA